MGLLSPDLYYTDVHAIDLQDLRERGVDSLLVDLDYDVARAKTNMGLGRITNTAAAGSTR